LRVNLRLCAIKAMCHTGDADALLELILRADLRVNLEADLRANLAKYKIKKP
jgi:hypothetical protein